MRLLMFWVVTLLLVSFSSVFAGNFRLVNTTNEVVYVQVRLSDNTFIGVTMNAASTQTISSGAHSAVGLVYGGVYYSNASMPVTVHSPAGKPMGVSQQLLEDAIEYAFSYTN